MPCTNATSISSHDFNMAGRHRLGYGIHGSAVLRPCSCRAGSNSAVDHAMVCDATAKQRTFRHDFYASAWRRVLHKAGIATTAEPRYGAIVGSAARAAAAGLHRGDILAVVEGQMTACDIVITHPGSASYVTAAARTTRATARRAEQRKVTAWNAVGRDSGYEFVPIAAETYGQLGSQGSQFLSMVADVAAASGISKARFVRAAHAELSCALVKGMGMVYSKSMHETVRASGRAFMEGSDVPVVE